MVLSNAPTVSIVLCTYNGAKYLREQLDSLIAQTYPIAEIIAQDDGSIDETLDILQEYAEKYPILKIYHNTDHSAGLSSNFFSAMRKTSGEFIAISDQDDIWEPRKIQLQVEAIGDALLCTCKTKPFSTDGLPVQYDDRTPNYHLVHLLFASIPGHTMLLRRELLDKVPPIPADCFGTAYDVVLASVAGSFVPISLVDSVLVHQRRTETAATYTRPDGTTRHSASNALHQLWWSVCNYRRVMPKVREQKLRPRLRLFESIQSDTADHRDALRISRLRAEGGFINLLRLSAMCIKHRNHLFYARTSGAANLLRAALYPLMQAYNFRHLL